MPTTLNELIIKGSRVEIELEKNGNNVYFTEIEGGVTELDVDANNLKDHN